jgi:hypothetical protein
MEFGKSGWWGPKAAECLVTDKWHTYADHLNSAVDENNEAQDIKTRRPIP